MRMIRLDALSPSIDSTPNNPVPPCAQDLRNTPELIALAVNLTQNTRNAEAMCEGDRFDRLIRRAFQTCDELAFKVGGCGEEGVPG